VFADSAYHRLAALLACFLLGLTLIIVRRLAGSTGFVLLPRRWVVERSFAWTTRFRRLVRDYERLPDTLAGLHFLAFAILMLKRIVMLMVQSA
jgi:putative transposase